MLDRPDKFTRGLSALEAMFNMVIAVKSFVCDDDDDYEDDDDDEDLELEVDSDDE